MPMFSHKLSAKQLEGHPEIDNWHAHRQGIENGILDETQLPDQFKSMHGQYRFARKSRIKPFNHLPEKQQRRRLSAMETYWKLKELKLDRTSAMPMFAKNLSRQQIEDHPDIDSWHQHREKIEQGLMKQHDLPPHFASSKIGALLFQTPKTKKVLATRYIRKRTAADSIQKRVRNAKLKELGLDRNSAIPIFVQLLAPEEIRHHADIDSWHQHRLMLEEGKITIENLPPHFKTRNGILRTKVAASVIRRQQKLNKKRKQ